MTRRQLLTDEERRRLFGVPADPDTLARHYTLTRSDLDLVAARRSDANRLGFAIQLALLRHHGMALPQMEEPVAPLVDWLARGLDLPAFLFAEYARRSQTMTDHARELAAILGLRPIGAADLPFMVEAASRAAWTTDKGLPIATGIIDALRAEGILLPVPAVIERVGIAGRARARKRVANALLAGITADHVIALDDLLAVPARMPGPAIDGARLTWMTDIPNQPRASHIRDPLDKLAFVRTFHLDPNLKARIPENRYLQFVREGLASPTYRLARYAANRRHATLVALLIDLEARLTDTALDMADRLIGGAFTRGKRAKEKTVVATTKDIGRLMRLFHGTIEALHQAQVQDGDALAAVDAAVGWAKLLRVRAQVADLADLAEEDPLVRASDRYITLRKIAPALFDAIEFKAAKTNDPTLAAIQLLRELNASGKRAVPADAPMPFRKAWRQLVIKNGTPNRRLYETAVLATLRNKLRSGDIWVERSANYRRFDSYLLPATAALAVTASLGLPATADDWLAGRGRALDRRLTSFARRLRQGQLDGVELRDDRLTIAPLKAATPPEAKALADRLDTLLPRVRITELLHEVNRQTDFAAAFTNLRTGEVCDNSNALLAVILADGTNLGLGRMAQASRGVTRDQLIWTADAYIRPETYQAALARIIDAHHRLPMAAVWGDGTTSSSDGQFFRSGKRGNAAGEVNARHGIEPGFSFYTHVSDQNGPYHVQTISAATHENMFVAGAAQPAWSGMPL